MKFLLSLFLIIFISLFSLKAHSQANIPVGTWRTHFSYAQVNTIVEAGTYVYAASDNGLFRVNSTNGRSEKISKIQGLSDTRIAILAYHQALSTVIVAYESGNIDLINSDGEIININDIIRSNSISGSKRINHIFIINEFAFLSCDFGLVKFNVSKLEITEDYRNLAIGNNSQIQIYSSTVSNQGDSIFIATSQGVMTAPFNNSVNLQDVNNWILFDDTDSLPLNGFLDIVTLDNSVFVSRNIDNSSQRFSELYQYKNGQWQVRDSIQNSAIRKIKMTNEKMVLIRGSDIFLWESEDSSSQKISNIDLFPNPQDFIIDKNQKNWVASPNRGLLSDIIGGAYSIYSPNGPITDIVARMAYSDGSLVIASGGRKTNFTQQGNEFGFSIYENGLWQNFLPKPIPNTTNIGIFVKDLYEPYFYKAGNFLSIGSIGYGVLMKYGQDSFQVFNQSNSTLFNLDPNGFPSTRITGITENSKGELVMTNSEAPSPINFYSPENGWRTLNFSAPKLGRVDQILTDNADNIWCRVINIDGGMLVFNEDEGQILSLNSGEGTGNLPTNSVNTMAIDLDGDIWIGTNDGVAVFFNPERIFNGGGINASTPIFENRPLLRDEIITSIEVDPANRKWIGTNNGVWLFEPDGTEVVANFTVANSPLINNAIIDIEINEMTGEVFFATRDGIVSFRGNATKSETICDNIRVFPNPVLPGYEGLVTINGVPENSIVKVVDMTGKLFLETRANGNSAVWDIRNYSNQKLQGGMYMILSSSQDGETTCNTKIAILD